MKLKSILAILLLVAGLQSALAQKLKLYLSDKHVVEYSVEKVDSLVFTDGAAETHEYVDLGLPSGTLWATCNVGANSPEEYGDYFAWGETEPKNDYSWINYRYCLGTENTMTKYCTNNSYGRVDYKTELEPSDDAATANWGSGWQMPSEEQFNELINSSYTTTTWTTMNGVNGYEVKSKNNGNSIFLPAAGVRSGISFLFAGSGGDYWSRSLRTSHSYRANSLSFSSSVINMYNYDRNSGRSVRPVRLEKCIAVSKIELNQKELSVKVGETTQLSATVLPTNATNKEVIWASSNTEIATVDEIGKVTAVANGTCMVTCSATDGSGVMAKCLVIVFSPGYADLGLPSGTLWATCNVGALRPEEYGDYFAWGETEPKMTFDWGTYKYCKGTDDTMTKYCKYSSYGSVDDKTELELSDDAATANWGGEWQMPSKEQLEELINNSYTTITWTSLNNVYGYRITSKSNGNSIFLPAAGGRYNTSLSNAGSIGRYWSHSLYMNYSHSAYVLGFDSNDNIMWGYGRRYSGWSVRPVVRPVDVSTIELSPTELSVKVGETSQLLATVLPENATNKAVVWESSNADVATVNQSGKVTSVAGGTCTITCSATDGSGVKAECKVTVKNDNSGTLDGHDYVDLGLPSGTLWATCNVGASSPEEYGDYFAWGETHPKSDNNYSRSAYRYYDSVYKVYTKYCLQSDYGTIDNKSELEMSDDAATANWGVDWQMPSLDQCEELYNNSYTSRTWTTLNGVKGRKITSKSNGNSIFLPAAGCRFDTSLYAAGSGGYYWSRSLYTSNSYSAYYLGFNSSNIYMDYFGYRSYGQSVRPVRVKN